MILIVGLGNFPKEYSNTYHNVGFMTLDKLSEKHNFNIKKNTGKALIYEGLILGKKVVVAEPQTFMNNSGESVVQLKNLYKPEKIIVVYDDIDVEIGEIRFRNNGSSGSHNGMRSIVNLLGTQDFARIRIGIKPQSKPFSLADYVLSKINKENLDNINLAINKAIDILENYVLLDGNLENKSL